MKGGLRVVKIYFPLSNDRFMPHIHRRRALRQFEGDGSAV